MIVLAPHYDELDSLESATDSTNLEKPDILFLVVNLYHSIRLLLNFLGQRKL